MNKRKRRRLKKKRILFLLLTLITLIVVPIILLTPRTYGYKRDVIKVFKEENIYETIKENKKYSKTLEVSIIQDNFNKKYLEEYLNITYIETDNFIDNINSLLELGYISNDINTFYQKLPNSINVILENSYTDNIINYLNLDYFNEEYLDTYIKYEQNDNKLSSVYDTTEIKNNYTYEDTVTFVNASLDKEYYTNDIKVDDTTANNLDVIVNKYYKLNSNYEPEDLQVINSKYATSNQRLRKEAAEMFEKMASDAKEENIKFYAGSTYRSYDYQVNLYNRYVKRDGQKEADTYSARAGYSEHQLGLAVDILNHNWSYIDENNVEYSWLIENSYKYGYILRYPRGKEYITGYMFEDWHFRYLGIDLATKVHNSNLTYDEYVARNL